MLGYFLGCFGLWGSHTFGIFIWFCRFFWLWDVVCLGFVCSFKNVVRFWILFCVEGFLLLVPEISPYTLQTHN